MSTVHNLTPRRERRDAVICLHSSGASGRQWDALAASLGTRFDVTAPNLRGYDGAVWPTGAPTSLDDEARAIAPLLDARPDGAHLIGHSYGGSVALQVALRWPSRVRSLTLYEPVRFAMLFADPNGVATGEAIVAIGRRIGFEVLSGRHHDAAAMFVDYWSGDGAWHALSAGRRDAVAARMPKVRAEFEALFADRVPPAAYAALEMPVRLIRGTRSPLPTRRVIELLAARLPRAEVVTLEGAGHMGPLTHAAAFEQALPEWLQPESEQLAA
jgi:pimeloyl-ACP methyl ester carboxylesterase